MTRIPYKSIDLVAPARALLGRAKVDSIEAVDGRTITFVDDGNGPPYYVVEGHQATPNYRIGMLSVVGGVVLTPDEEKKQAASSAERQKVREEEAAIKAANRPARPPRHHRSPDARRSPQRKNPNSVERIRPTASKAASKRVSEPEDLEPELEPVAHEE